MEPNPNSDQATLEAIAALVRLHVGQEVYHEFLPWSRTLSRSRRLAFLKEIGRFDIQTSIPLAGARQPDATLQRKAEQALAYCAVALWHISELRTATRRDDETG